MRLPTPPHEPELPPRPTIAFSSPLPTLLQSIANADKEAEKKRLERRKKREKERQNSILSDTASPATATPTGPATPGADVAVKITKKQAAKESKQAVTDEVQRKQANATAAMALGGMSRKYSWMTAAPKATSGLQAGVGLGRGGTPGSSKTGGAVAAQPQEDAGLRSKEYYKKLGLWREDGVNGQGIQIRDWITVLERDGVEKKTLAKSYARLSSGDKER
jgi:Transcription initiation factor TFIID component TAF4 family